MKSLQDLINVKDSAWPLIQQWCDQGRNKMEWMSPIQPQNEKVLTLLQITVRSPMGAIAYHSGGCFIHNRLIRLMGAGSNEIELSLTNSNGLSNNIKIHAINGAFVVAYDVFGGFFAINSGRFNQTDRFVYYLSPDNLEWESTSKTYSDILYLSLIHI
ncbi:MAG: DUF2625 domain-containing protein, partial [Candidatus Saccharibacteria bacterium]|nr:DUF2625 domain-containing protein [Candidatus Saccharibacteria bacterium]